MLSLDFGMPPSYHAFRAENEFFRSKRLSDKQNPLCTDILTRCERAAQDLDPAAREKTAFDAKKVKNAEKRSQLLKSAWIMKK